MQIGEGFELDTSNFLVRVAILSSIYFIFIFIFDVISWIGIISEVQNALLIGVWTISYALYMMIFELKKIDTEIKKI